MKSCPRKTLPGHRTWPGGHDQSNPAFNADVRQLLHVGYKVAAKLGDHYLDMLAACETSIARNVTQNLYDRHILPLFLEA